MGRNEQKIRGENRLYLNVFDGNTARNTIKTTARNTIRNTIRNTYKNTARYTARNTFMYELMYMNVFFMDLLAYTYIY